jgi:transposase
MDFERSLDKLQDVAMRFDQFTTIKEYLLMANRNEYLLKKKKKKKKKNFKNCKKRVAGGCKKWILVCTNGLYQELEMLTLIEGLIQKIHSHMHDDISI